jgi:hypothetical protein
MSIATLDDIIKKVRRLTGSGNSLQLTDANIIDHINSFYLYDFPAEFRSLHLEDKFVFNTVANIETYEFDFQHYSTLQNPAYVDKRVVNLYSNPDTFYNIHYSERVFEKLDTGDGSTGSYAGTLSNIPVKRSYNNNPIADTQTTPTATFATGSYPANFQEPSPSRVQQLLITANTATSTLNVTDDGTGNLIGGATAGTINYATGAVSGLIFSSAVPSGTDINVSYLQVSASRPTSILFYQNQITLSPVPDRGYTVEIDAWRRPSQVLLGSSDPTSPTTTGVPEL